jgi:hypothetical protein
MYHAIIAIVCLVIFVLVLANESLCVCVYPYTREGGNTPCGGAGTPNGASIHNFSYDFFEFELKPTGKGSADPTQ